MKMKDPAHLLKKTPIIVRKSADRGNSNHGWLNSYHSFSFANYYDPRFNGFHSLLVLNEDRVAPTKGFAVHPHAEMEIVTYVISGEQEHRDSIGNREVIARGDIQITSAGTGIRHGEHNASKTEWVHYLQFWIDPNVYNTAPSYKVKHFSDEEKKGKLRLIISNDGKDGSLEVHQDIKVFACILQKNVSVTYTWPADRAGYIHLADTRGGLMVRLQKSSLLADDVILQAGDGAYVSGGESVSIVGSAERSEFVLFDVNNVV